MRGDELAVIDITLADGRDASDIETPVGVCRWIPQLGTLYGVLKIDGARELVTIDPATGIATSVGVLDHKFEDISFDGCRTTLRRNEKIPILQLPNRLFAIDKTDASSTLITSVKRALAYPRRLDTVLQTSTCIMAMERIWMGIT